MSRAYTIAPFDGVVESLQVDGQWKSLCMPVRVDSGQVVHVVGDTVYFYYPHVCAAANSLEVVIITVAAFAFGALSHLVLKMFSES